MTTERGGDSRAEPDDGLVHWFGRAAEIDPSIVESPARLGGWLSTATAARHLVRLGMIAGVAVAVALIPSVDSIEPSRAVTDLAVILIVASLLAVVVLWWIERRVDREPDGSAATEAPDRSAREVEGRLGSLAWSALALLVAAAILVVGLGLFGGREGGEGPEDIAGSGSTLADDASVTASPSTVADDVDAAGSASTATEDADGGALGTSQSPYPVGQEVSLFYQDPVAGAERVWLVEVLETAMGDTDGRVADADLDPVLVRLRVTNDAGDGPVRTGDLQFELVGPSGRVYRTGGPACLDADVLGADLELSITEAAEGWLCWSVPASEAGPLVLAAGADPARGAAYLAIE